MSSNDATEIACTWTDKGLVHMARCERLDQSIGQTAPLQLRELRNDFVRHLRSAARTRLLPPVRDAEAAARLSQLLREWMLRMDGITAPAERSDWLLAYARDYYSYCDDNEGWQYASRSKLGPSSTADGKPSKTRLLAAVEHIETGGWRQLFAQAIGRASVDEVGLAHYQGRPLLTWGLAAFELMTGELRPFALCNHAANLDQFELYDAA